MRSANRLPALLVFLVSTLLSPALPAADRELQYDRNYQCGSEIIQVGHCRRDSDMPGYPATTDSDNYCQVYYPSRPKNAIGGTAFGIELRSDLEKMLRACGALAPVGAPAVATNKPSAPAASGTVRTRSTAENQAYAVYQEGTALAAARNYVAAIEAYKKSNAIHPQSGTWTNLGHAYYQLSRYPEALAAYRQALALNSGNANAQLGAGLTLYDDRHYAEALPFLREGLRLKPETDWAHNTLANALFMLKKYDEAAQAYRDAIRLKPADAGYHRNLGNALYDLKRYADAAASAREAIRLDPKLHDAHNLLGNALFMQKQYAEAVKTYRAAVALSPANAVYHFNVGEAYRESKQPEPAITAFQEATRLNPKDPVAWNNLGLCLYGVKRYPEALSALQKARDLKPDQNLYLGNIGFALVRLGRLHEAAQIAKQLQARNDGQAKDLQDDIDRQSGRITLDAKPVRPAGVPNPRIEMVWVAPGSFTMGGGFADTLPAHQVTIANGFFIGRYEVTQAQWKAVMGGNPSDFKTCGDNCPVEQVTWDAVQVFLKFLNDASDGYVYRLPSEAEWEYAFRAGTTGQHYAEGEIGWNGSNSGGKTHPVGQLKPNALGLYDIAGNVGELCSDWYHESYEGAPADGSPWLAGGEKKWRVVRGGTFYAPFTSMNATTRLEQHPESPSRTVGLRVVAVRKAR